jgi:hypothetical protein
VTAAEPSRDRPSQAGVKMLRQIYVVWVVESRHGRADPFRVRTGELLRWGDGRIGHDRTGMAPIERPA